MGKKETSANWRKHYHNEYKTGRMTYEKKLVQWTHIMLLDEMFELQKRGECLLYKNALKRYGRPNVERLLEQSFLRKDRSNFNDEVCIYCEQIDQNIIDVDNTSDTKRRAANIRHHGNPEGKKGNTEPYMSTNAFDNYLEEKQKDKYANDNLLRVDPEVQKLLDAGEEEKNKKKKKGNEPYMGTDFIT